jgi:hypothetical protein
MTKSFITYYLTFWGNVLGGSSFRFSSGVRAEQSSFSAAWLLLALLPSTVLAFEGISLLTSFFSAEVAGNLAVKGTSCSFTGGLSIAFVSCDRAPLLGGALFVLIIIVRLTGKVDDTSLSVQDDHDNLFYLFFVLKKNDVRNGKLTSLRHHGNVTTASATNLGTGVAR